MSIYASYQPSLSQVSYRKNTHTYRLLIVKDQFDRAQRVADFISKGAHSTAWPENVNTFFEMVAGAGFEPTTFGL